MQTQTGKCSTFGGPDDRGVKPNEGLALIRNGTQHDARYSHLFKQPFDPALGLARNLNPKAFYCAMRWNYNATPVEVLRRSIVRVESELGRVVWCFPADWGPNALTGRLIDLSPGAAQALLVKTDDIVSAKLYCGNES